MPHIASSKPVLCRTFPAHTALLGLLIPASVTAQKPVTIPVDIAVRIFPVYGHSMPDVEDRDFHVQQDRRKLAFTVQRFPSSRSALTFALLDLAHCRTSLSPSPLELSQEMAALFKLGWWVSVLDTRGSQTPFAHSAAEYAVTIPVPSRSELEAVSSLNQNVGRHIVFALCTPSRSLPPAVTQEAESALAPLLAINPGSPVYGPAYALPDDSVPSPTNDMGMPTSYFSSFGGLVRDRILPAFWPLDQPTFRDALQTAKAVDDQFYILHVPRSPIVPELTVRVHIEGYADQKFHILAQAYTERQRAPRILLDPKP